MKPLARSRESTWLPPDCFRGPVVLLDSGRSLCEAHFLEPPTTSAVDEGSPREPGIQLRADVET